jgi:hypothetical protein
MKQQPAIPVALGLVVGAVRGDARRAASADPTRALHMN